MRFFEGVFSTPRWLALWAAQLGFMLDAMDVLLYVFALTTLKTEFGWTNAQAGLVSSVTLIASAAGGIVAGAVSDRIGRRRTLIYTILLYSLASAGTATSRGIVDLVFWRALVGLGLGGEWSAGATLVAESWPAEHRAKAVSFMQSGWALGYMAAAGLSAWILPAYGWRALFLAGVFPALVTVFIRRKVEEPEIWLKSTEKASFLGIFRPPVGRRTLFATILATSVLFAYWGLFTWLPGFLSSPIAQGGAGMSILKTSGFVFAVQMGAFYGYLCFGVLADRWGRRPAFAFYVGVAALLTPLYGFAPRVSPMLLLLLGPCIGFFGTGFFSLFGTMLAELYPTAMRGAGQGFVYNFGRGLSALAPYAVGSLADRFGLGAALGLNSAFFLAASLLVFLLPETKQTKLETV
ncbi:MFS transporter [Paludibaculum fermentans]|uniref:MFS transporter n=1 Tax=Paludibaculum fermentans TaxID=1473598 RepID=UPI003EB988F3